MGAYSELKYGDFEVFSYKGYVPVLPMLLFTANDLCVTENPDCTETVALKYRFVTRVAKARQQLDLKGLDLAFCRGTFSDLLPDLRGMVSRMRREKSEEPEWHKRLKERVQDAESEPIKLYEWTQSDIHEGDLSFDWYLDALRRVYREKEERYFPLEFSPHNWNNDPEAMLIANICQGEIATESGWVFDELLFAMTSRAWLEILDDHLEVELDFTDLVDQEYISKDEVGQLYETSMRVMQRQMEADYRLYGYILRNDPRIDQQLRTRIASLEENDLIVQILLPLLSRLGYSEVRAVAFHGPGEFGRDILPFRYHTPLGTVEYYALQAKSVDIHGKSRQQGNAGELISQATQAFSVRFVDPIDNEVKRIDKFVIATNKAITQAARHVIEQALQGSRSLVLIDLDRLVTLVKSSGLDHYVLFGVDSTGVQNKFAAKPSGA